jgi:hypothetical protein
LLGFIPDKSELVVLIVDGDDDKRLEFWSNELLARAVFFVDKSELLVDNNEDAVDGFFESAIFLIAQYCIITRKYSIKSKEWEWKILEYLKGIFLAQYRMKGNGNISQGKRKTRGSTYSCLTK